MVYNHDRGFWNIHAHLYNQMWHYQRHSPCPLGCTPSRMYVTEELKSGLQT